MNSACRILPTLKESCTPPPTNTHSAIALCGYPALELSKILGRIRTDLLPSSCLMQNMQDMQNMQILQNMQNMQIMQNMQFFVLKLCSFQRHLRRFRACFLNIPATWWCKSGNRMLSRWRQEWTMSWQTRTHCSVLLLNSRPQSLCLPMTLVVTGFFPQCDPDAKVQTECSYTFKPKSQNGKNAQTGQQLEAPKSVFASDACFHSSSAFCKEEFGNRQRCKLRLFLWIQMYITLI